MQTALGVAGRLWKLNVQEQVAVAQTPTKPLSIDPESIDTDGAQGFEATKSSLEMVKRGWVYRQRACLQELSRRDKESRFRSTGEAQRTMLPFEDAMTWETLGLAIQTSILRGHG